MEILFATGNQHKMKEIKDILTPPQFELISMQEAGIDLDVIEDGSSFEENAIIKATEILAFIKVKLPQFSHKIVMADDSGLEIDFLNKEPGINSARYMGHDTSYDLKNMKILELMKDVPVSKRSARFVCAIATAFPDGRIITSVATIEGLVAFESKGNNGFGYDPIFYVNEYKMTVAEMDSQLKNSISHRGKALKQMKDKLFAED